MDTPVFRGPRPEDLRHLVALLADDPLGSTREQVADPLPPAYGQALQAILADPNQDLLVAELGGRVVGMLQLTYIPSLTYEGRWRAQIDGVRVAGDARSSGLGSRMVQEAVHRARDRGCRMVQLTTDKRRPRAVSFYQGLGFVASHEGMKLHLI